MLQLIQRNSINSKDGRNIGSVRLYLEDGVSRGHYLGIIVCEDEDSLVRQ